MNFCLKLVKWYLHLWCIWKQRFPIRPRNVQWCAALFLCIRYRKRENYFCRKINF